MNRRTRFASALIATAALALGGCANSEQDSTKTSGATEAAGSAQSAAESAAADATGSTDEGKEGESLSLDNGVVRASKEGSDMTAIFGELNNPTDKDITVAGFHSDVEADMNQLHETIDGQMREMTKPLVVPAGGSVKLEPGSTHLMIMGMKEPIKAGDTLSLTLELEDGSEVDAGEIPVRTMGAGNENYGDISGHEGHAGHEGHQGHADHAGHSN